MVKFQLFHGIKAGCPSSLHLIYFVHLFGLKVCSRNGGGWVLEYSSNIGERSNLVCAYKYWATPILSIGFKIN